MNNNIYNIKEFIENLLAEALSDEGRKRFLRNPEKDFTRNRLFSLSSLYNYLLTRISGTLTHSLQSYFGLGRERPSKAALVKSMDKLKLEFFSHMFSGISRNFCQQALYRGKYRIVACDGTNLEVPPEDLKCFRCYKSGNGLPDHSMHINAFYDVLSDAFLDAIVEFGKDYNEIRACSAMAERLGKDVLSIITCDRGYEGYELFAHLIISGHFFLIRLKDVSACCRGMAHYWWKRLNGPEGEGEVLVKTKITKAYGKLVRQDPSFHCIPQTSPFDLLPDSSHFPRGIVTKIEDIPPECYHEMAFRLVRFRINEPGSANEFETVATNLPPDSFGAKELKEIYHLRWNEETAFRKLKYNEMLLSLHHRKTDRILAEIYLSMTMHNITSFLVSVTREAKSKEIRDGYAISYSDAAHAARLFLDRASRFGPEELMQELARNVVKVKAGRSYPRLLKPKSFIPFMYRAS